MRACAGGFHKRKLAGTLEYLAPEVLMKGSHSPASDVYALGVTLNEVCERAVRAQRCMLCPCIHPQACNAPAYVPAGLVRAMLGVALGKVCMLSVCAEPCGCP